MHHFLLFIFSIVLSQAAMAANEGALKEGMVNPGYYEKPEWFKQSFLDLRDEIEDANDNNKRVMLYFHQDGCPYCKKLLDDNFSRQSIVEKMKQHYDLLEINMWGDKTVTLLDGEELSEKEFAQKMKVMFTPTLVVLDNKGQSLFRMNGYYAPDKFSAVLDYLLLTPVSESTSSKEKISFNEFYRANQQANEQQSQPKRSASGKLHRESFIVQENNLQKLILNSHKPVLILFEQTVCSACDELHGDIFRRLPIFKQLKQFTITQIDINSDKKIITPDGQSMTHKSFAQASKVQYTPSIFFYEAGQPENNTIFRSEGYLKSFHIQALLDYIMTDAYLTEPEFQRFVQRRAEWMREKGQEVNLWD